MKDHRKKATLFAVQCPDTRQRGEGVELNVPDQRVSTISYTGDSLTEKGRGPLIAGHRGESTSNPLSHVCTFDDEQRQGKMVRTG